MNESVEEAIADDIKALGGPKPAAGHFFADKTPDQGAATLRAWSIEGRAERPSPSQLLLLMELARKRVGYSEIGRFMEQRLNCRIEFLTPEDEQAKLQREYIAAVNRLQSLANRIEINGQRVRA
jgi:hypothetical protein